MVSLAAVIVAVVELIDPIVVVVVIVVEEVVLEDMEVKELGTISIVTEIQIHSGGSTSLKSAGLQNFHPSGNQSPYKLE